MKFSKKIVTSIILLNILFTLGVFYVVMQGYTEPTGLIVAWFGFTTVELWSLASIKRAEAKNEYMGGE